LDRRRNHYQVLQVDPAADRDVIATVYRRLALRYHPDREPSPEARQRMLAINAAWEVLKDPERRAAYDRELERRRDRRTSDRLVRRPGEVTFGAAGVPVGPPSGSVLEFGRYQGWTLGQVARKDPEFLEWLERIPAGRRYRDEIATLLRRR
jgi:curved DNA-binding protein CbpA